MKSTNDKGLSKTAQRLKDLDIEIQAAIARPLTSTSNKRLQMLQDSAKKLREEMIRFRAGLGG
jgi:hypothetical protein